MSRSDLMAQLLRLAHLGAQCERSGQSADEVLGQETQEALRDAGRRRFTQGAIAAAAAATAGTMAPTAWVGAANLSRMVQTKLLGRGNVAVIGAGLAGLCCASELARLGVSTRVFEADARVGGRVRSLRGYFPGQTVELGGEFIGRTHNTMLGYARALDLTLEDASQFPGQRYYDFGGHRYSEAQVVEEFRGFTESIRNDIETLSFPTADRHTEADALFDFMTLDEYLQLHGASDLLRHLLGAAYKAEYGAGIDEQSALGFLRFTYADNRAKFSPFGGAGDTHFHIAEGNDSITTALARTLPTPVALGHRLIDVRKLASGRVRLTFDLGGRRVQSDFDAVVLTVPFTVLRGVQLHANLELPAWKRLAIDNATMSDNSKLMVGFERAYWYLQHECNGSGCSDRTSLQSTWESNPTNGGEARAVLTQLVGGAQARAMDPKRLQRHAAAFVGDLERVLPGAQAAARRKTNGDYLAHLENWSRNPLSKGAYSCHRPGYFTSVAHNEAKPVGNLLFAGEHTSSFYEWQGTMEGAANSGLRAAYEAFTLLGGR
jgi:monoamine oxidase